MFLEMEGKIQISSDYVVFFPPVTAQFCSCDCFGIMTAGVTQFKTERIVYGGIVKKIECNLQDSVITRQSPDVGRPKQ